MRRLERERILSIVLARAVQTNIGTIHRRVINEKRMNSPQSSPILMHPHLHLHLQPKSYQIERRLAAYHTGHHRAPEWLEPLATFEM